jgi:hypothetical protein
MLSARFESKLGLKTQKGPPRRMQQYTLEDARADARLLLAQTEDRAYPLGRLEPLLHDPDSSLHEAVQTHYEHLKVLSLGAAYSLQALRTAAAGTDMASSTPSIATATMQHADAVGSIGGGARALCDALPLSISLSVAASPQPQRSSGSGTVGNAPLSAASLKQLAKDLARDRLIINGCYVVGAEAGVEGVQALVRVRAHMYICVKCEMRDEVCGAYYLMYVLFANLPHTPRSC